MPTTKKGAAKSSTPKSKSSPELDEALFSLLNQAFENGLSLDEGIFAPESATDLIEEFLVGCQGPNADDDEIEAIGSDILEALTGLRIDANGGARAAREELQGIYDLLEAEFQASTLPAPYILMLGKLLTDAGLDVPESMKAATAVAFAHFSPESSDIEGANPLSALSDIINTAAEDPFQAHELLRSTLSSFPNEVGAQLLRQLASTNDATMHLALIGFLLHPDPQLASCVADALVQVAPHTSTESRAIERLVRMRPWVPSDRQYLVDLTVRAMRTKAKAPQATTLPTTIKCYASICDGSGASTILATQRHGRGYQVCTFMLKHTGVIESLVLKDMGKRDMDRIVRSVKTTMPLRKRTSTVSPEFFD